MKKIFSALQLLSILIMVNGAASASDKPVAETKYFSFYSNYSLNLHHYLYMKGELYKRARTDQQQYDFVFFGDTKAVVPDADRAKAMQAVKFYADSVISRNLLFDPGMTATKYALQASTDVGTIDAKSVSAGMLSAMKLADNFYKTFIWSSHDAANLKFVSTHAATIKDIEAEVIAACEKFYNYKFDGHRYRVDLVDYATFFGAYTTSLPYVSAVISSNDGRHAGSQGVEVVFHEVSHAMVGPLMSLVNDQAKALNITADRNLWHIIQFYTTGTFVKNALTAKGKPHELYLYANKLSDVSPVIGAQIASVDKHWPDCMAGKKSQAEGIAAILSDSK